MNERKYTSMRVPQEKKMELERAAIDISYSTGQMVKWTDLVFYLIDEHLKDATKDLKASTRSKGILDKKK